MERWKQAWLCLNLKKIAFHLHTKEVLSYVASLFKSKTKARRQSLVTLYRDMEDCAEYEDIQVMWEMINSSCHSEAYCIKGNKRAFLERFCFRPI
ncbi:hypothetical protein LIER_42811 [Lithospermum erythrorhizon]|uniref:Uncharacterized protein n=1 Tax=Lithospermum erythrorhizon TaxID=34254 RepID=A0AAV3NZA3_LITER